MDGWMDGWINCKMNMKNKIVYRKNPGFSNPDMGRNKTFSPLSSSGRVVSPLAGRRSPTDELLELGIVSFTWLGSFNQPVHISGVGCTDAVGSVISARFFVFCDIRRWSVFRGVYSNGLSLAQGTFVKRRSSLGRFS
jgi:hypothetical protein